MSARLHSNMHHDNCAPHHDLLDVSQEKLIQRVNKVSLGIQVLQKMWFEIVNDNIHIINYTHKSIFMVNPST